VLRGCTRLGTERKRRAASAAVITLVGQASDELSGPRPVEWWGCPPSVGAFLKEASSR